MKYRKKPVVIEAWQWNFDKGQEKEPPWIIDAMGRWPFMDSLSFEPEYKYGPRIMVHSPEGMVIAVPGDWIIRGVKGEFYPCKPDIFEMTYEQVEG